MNEFWNDRYSQDEYVYGTKPNAYFKQEIDKLNPPGKILLPADGEGRNAVYAASLGWSVTAFDFSVEGRRKALSLAESRNVRIDYLIRDIADATFKEASFDAIALIYVHLPSASKGDVMKRLMTFLKPGGRVIMEAFSKEHLTYQQLNPSVGGPSDPDRFYSLEEMNTYFPGFTIEDLREEVIDLSEGEFHKGRSSVIRFTGIKQ